MDKEKIFILVLECGRTLRFDKDKFYLDNVTDPKYYIVRKKDNENTMKLMVAVEKVVYVMFDITKRSKEDRDDKVSEGEQ